jgi:hypothetical protein
MAQYGVATTNPNSALSQAAIAAQQASDANRDTRVNNNSYFSSFSQKDQGNIASAHDRAINAAYETFQNALRDYNTAVTNARNAYNDAILPYQTDERNQAIANLPTPTVTSGANPSTGTIPSNASIAPTGGAHPTNPQTTTHPPAATHTTHISDPFGGKKSSSKGKGKGKK